MRRHIKSGFATVYVAAAALAAFGASATSASAQTSVNVAVGGFLSSGTQSSNGVVTGRADGDVVVQNSSFLDFDFHQFNGPFVNADFLIGLGPKFDAGVGVGFHQRTVLSADAFSEFEGTGNPILADLKLRVVPIDATFRFLPLGRRGVEPYIGAGVGIYPWHYREIGDFVASDNVTIISGDFSGSGTAVGPVILGGVRVPVGNWTFGGEIKWEGGTGDLPANQGFAGSTIDLTVLNIAFTFGVRF